MSSSTAQRPKPLQQAKVSTGLKLPSAPAASISIDERKRRVDPVLESWRRARLQELVTRDYAGSKVALEIAMGRKPSPGRDKPDGAKVSHLLSPKHAFGEITARRMERSLGLETGWLDQAPIAGQGALSVPMIDLQDAGLRSAAVDAPQVVVPWPVGSRAMAVVMPDDSMSGPTPQTTPISIPAGYTVIVDPDYPVDMSTPCIVCVRVPGSASATIRRLWSLDGVTMLRPNNPLIWDNSKMLTKQTVIVGRVRGALATC
jgi:hypothetical protein